MKKFFLLIILILFSATNLKAEYRLEPVQCTLKKQANCGAYLYNSRTGATYYCNSEKCNEVMPAFEVEETTEEELSKGSKKKKKSKIPKKPKIKKKKSKIPKFKKKKSE